MEPLDFVNAARKMIRGFTWHGTFPEACALVVGYAEGLGTGMLREFQEWIGARYGRPELAFWCHILAAEVPNADPSGRGMSEEENQLAIDALFQLLDEFFRDVATYERIDRHK